MTPLSPDQVLEALRFRYATKKFDPAKLIPPQTWEALENSLVLTPSSFGLQPWQFLVVRDPEIRRQLQAEAWNQSQVTEASHYLVLACRTNLDDADLDAWIECLALAQGSTAETLTPFKAVIQGFIAKKTPEAIHAWNQHQAYIALGQLMASAAFLGIDTCPMEGINPAGYDRILGLEGSGYATVVACALGYRSDDDKYAAMPKARFPLEKVVKHLGGHA